MCSVAAYLPSTAHRRRLLVFMIKISVWCSFSPVAWLRHPRAVFGHCFSPVSKPSRAVQLNRVALSADGKTSMMQCGRNQSGHMWRWTESHVSTFLLRTMIRSPMPKTRTLFYFDYCMMLDEVYFLCLASLKSYFNQL